MPAVSTLSPETILNYFNLKTKQNKDKIPLLHGSTYFGRLSPTCYPASGHQKDAYISDEALNLPSKYDSE